MTSSISASRRRSGDPPRRPGASGRRDRHVRPPREVDGRDEGEPRGAQRPRGRSALPGHPRRGALTRAYVENDLAAVYAGEVRYARDAFEGLRLMDAVALAKATDAPVGQTLRRCGPDGSGPTWSPTRTTPSRHLTLRCRRRQRGAGAAVLGDSRVVRGVPLKDYAAYLDERATFLGQWGLRGSRGDGPSYEEPGGDPGTRLRMWLDRIATDGWSRRPWSGLPPCYRGQRHRHPLARDRPRRAACGRERARLASQTASGPAALPGGLRRLPRAVRRARPVCDVPPAPAGHHGCPGRRGHR